MDVSGVSKVAGAQIHQWSYYNGGNQKWMIESAPAVPNIVGQTLLPANDYLKAKGLTMGALSYQVIVNRSDLAGKVASHTPVAGAKVLPGSSVALVLYKNVAQVPSLVGQTLTQAQAAIQAAKLTAQISYQNIANRLDLNGKVSVQNPAAGQKVNPGTSVAISVYKSVIAVPDIISNTASAGSLSVRNVGLTSEVVQKNINDFALLGKVISTNPQKGTVVASGSKVTINNGYRVVMPNWAGQAYETWTSMGTTGFWMPNRTIIDQSFKLTSNAINSALAPTFDSSKLGRIHRTEPAAGTVLSSKGVTHINLHVYKYPKTPGAGNGSFNSKSVAQLRAELNARGITNIVLKLVYVNSNHPRYPGDASPCKDGAVRGILPPTGTEITSASTVVKIRYNKLTTS